MNTEAQGNMEIDGKNEGYVVVRAGKNLIICGKASGQTYSFLNVTYTAPESVDAQGFLKWGRARLSSAPYGKTLTEVDIHKFKKSLVKEVLKQIDGTLTRDGLKFNGDHHEEISEVEDKYRNLLNTMANLERIDDAEYLTVREILARTGCSLDSDDMNEDEFMVPSSEYLDVLRVMNKFIRQEYPDVESEQPD